MQFEEQPLSFDCNGQPLVGIVGVPEQGQSRGVLIVVGGPQYRVGSHRQFTLLARSLAGNGIPVMRFDYRGMGDSDGEMRNFEDIDDDLRVAIDRFVETVPGLNEIIIWGLCDGASAALFYAHKDQRVVGLVLANPWVRTTGGIAKATLKHYYVERLSQRDLWRKIFSGKFNCVTAATSFFKLIANVLSSDKQQDAMVAVTTNNQDARPLPDRMFDGFNRFTGNVLFIISGVDLTAQEFTDMVDASRSWKRLLAASRVSMRKLDEADHTFSRRVWRDQVSTWTGDWIRSW